MVTTTGRFHDARHERGGHTEMIKHGSAMDRTPDEFFTLLGVADAAA
jgi:hypothetical protein